MSVLWAASEDVEPLMSSGQGRLGWRTSRPRGRRGHRSPRPILPRQTEDGYRKARFIVIVSFHGLPETTANDEGSGVHLRSSSTIEDGNTISLSAPQCPSLALDALDKEEIQSPRLGRRKVSGAASGFATSNRTSGSWVAAGGNPSVLTL